MNTKNLRKINALSILKTKPGIVLGLWPDFVAF